MVQVVDLLGKALTTLDLPATAVLPGEEQYFSEKVVRLQGTRFCYEPVPYAPDVAPLPCRKNGWITFGSLPNRSCL